MLQRGNDKSRRNYFQRSFTGFGGEGNQVLVKIMNIGVMDQIFMFIMENIRLQNIHNTGTRGFR